MNALDDPRLEPFRSLRAGPWGIADGDRPVEALLRSGLKIQAIVCEPGEVARLESTAGPERMAGVSLITLPRHVLSELVGYAHHRGVMAAFERPAPSSLHDLGDRILVLEAVEKGENVGGLLRSADAFGVGSVIIDRATVSPWDRRAIRASTGAVFRARVHVTEADLPSTLAELRARGYAVASTAMGETAVSIYEARFAPRLCLCFGNEARGISKGVLRETDQLLKVPMAENVDSLNVGAAAAVVLSRLFERSPTPLERR